MAKIKLTDKYIWAALYKIIKDDMELPEKPGMDQNLIDFGFDDLDDVEFILLIEERFGIEIPDDDAVQFKTLRDHFNYLKQLDLSMEENEHEETSS